MLATLVVMLPMSSSSSSSSSSSIAAAKNMMRKKYQPELWPSALLLGAVHLIVLSPTLLLLPLLCVCSWCKRRDSSHVDKGTEAVIVTS